jgi:Mg-chelatase subunit ChlD
MSLLGAAAPAALLLLLAVPLLALVAARPTAIALRALAAIGLVLVLAGVFLRWPRPAGGACAILAIDVSASVQDAGIDAAARVLPALARALGPRDLVGVVAFADGARVVAAPSPTPPTPAAMRRAGATARLAPDASDLAAALRLASPLCPDGTQAAVLLLSDGQETRGSVLAEAAVADPALPVFPLRLDATGLPPAIIRRVLAPTVAPDRTVVPLEAVVESGLPAPVDATADDGAPDEVAASLLPGLTVVALPYRARDPGRHEVAAALRVPAEGPLLPGAVRFGLDVAARPRVLVVTERPSSVVGAALAGRGMQVDLVRPETLASRIDRLAADDVVVLDDVGRDAIASASLEELARRVALGGALVVTGGPHLFGDPAWADSPIARLLPVELRSQAPEPKEREPIALELVIDRSNSMGFSTRPDPTAEGEKMEYARRAALAVLDQLGPRDLVGAIAFDSQPYELAPLVAVAEGRDALAARIRALRHGGGTDFKDALEIARRHLDDAPRAVRHVILLTDGDTNRRSDDHRELIAALARDGITVTAIRIGQDTGNVELLEEMAHDTGGEFHHVPDAAALPQLMIRDTRRLVDAPGSLVNAPARIAHWGPMLAGLTEEELPRVARWATTTLKDDAELRLYLDAGNRRDPLLATWQYQLGRVAVLPVDFQSGAAEWAGWDGFGPLWAQLVLWARPRAAEAAARPPDDAAAGREFRALGPNRSLLAQLAAATGGAVDPEPAAVLAARPGVEQAAVPLTRYLVPLVILLLLGDIALRLRQR